MSFLSNFKRVLRKLLPWRLEYLIDVTRLKGHFPHILCPRDYSDYIFRDNLLGRHNKHAYLADKYLVRGFVTDRGLERILTRLYGVWDNADEIPFDSLPKGFALKCNHSCGTNIICQDKAALNINETVLTLNRWLKVRHPIYFEQHYRHIQPRIICEELIPLNNDGSFPSDYKIHCANGKPVFIQCCFERTSSNPGFRKIYDTEWNDLHFVLEDYHYSDEQIPKPKHLKEMLEYAAILSKGLEYARIDLYDTEDRVIFGEITLTPMGGLLSYFTQDALDTMGDAIKRYN